MKKVILFVAIVATCGFISCNKAKVNAEKATQDSIAEVARLDSIAKVKSDSIRAAIEALEADSLEHAVEETVPTSK